ncbi:MAG: hypothetical protein IH594_11415 [Bacteroidales bacterium]|nr:hypothetical protein [Bacteroidales bacterium]
MTRAGVKWREIGRPEAYFSIARLPGGRPISLRLTDDDLSFRPRERSDSAGSKGGTS